MEFGKHVPQSTIIFKEEIRNWRMIATELYKRYIMIGAEYEINLNGVERAKLRNIFEVNRSLLHRLSVMSVEKDMFDNIHNFNWNDIKELSNIFDECIDEMLKLLSYSLSRFKTKPEYTKLTQHKAATMTTKEDIKGIMQNTLII